MDNAAVAELTHRVVTPTTLAAKVRNETLIIEPTITETFFIVERLINFLYILIAIDLIEAKGWRQKVESVGVFGSQTRVIHNATDYQLTHLLEHGYIHHDTGKRVGQRAHIEAVEQESIAEFTRKVEAL